MKSGHVVSRLQGQVAVVIGGASGVGPGIAVRLAREGARVTLLHAGDVALGESAEVELKSTDFASKSELTRSIDEVAVRHGRIDILVNAANGDAQPLALATLAEEDFAAQFSKSFDACRWGMQAAFPHMQAQGGGYIVNIVSVYGVSMWRSLGPYQAAMEAIKALTRTAAEEWGRYGILVNALVPAADTASYRRDRSKAPELVDRIVQNTPLGRMGDVERDIAGAVLLLVTASGRYLTGHVIHADGGQHLAPSPYEALIPAG